MPAFFVFAAFTDVHRSETAAEFDILANSKTMVALTLPTCKRETAMISARVHGPLLACVLLIAGCAEGRQLMPTPNLYTDEKATLFQALPQEYASTQVELLYVTDCERCIMTTTDQKTGERPTKEPLKTLSTYRKRENKYASGVMFGAYMTAGREGKLAIGDRLEVATR